VPRHSIVRALLLIGWKLLTTAKGAFDVTMIGAERPDSSTGVAVILGVDTHLDFHLAVALDHLGREAWARPVCQRPRRATKGFSAGRRVLAP
jgi:hypothetical protein